MYVSIERRNLAQRKQDFDRTRAAGRSLDQATPFERDDHGVHRRRCYLEVALKVGFRRRAPAQFGVRHDECQVLTLKLRESVFRQLFLPAINSLSAV